MGNREAQARLIPTPFIASFVGKAHEGDLFAESATEREAAWAWWVVDSLEEFKGISDREYAAIKLSGKFHTPGDVTSPKVAPHLEIPQRILERPDAEFPARIAAAGNAILFPWWLVGEVTAAKRAIFNTPRSSVAPLLAKVADYREGLCQSVESLSRRVSGKWGTVETLLAATPERLVGLATGDADTQELTTLFPPASELSLSLAFDPQLRESNGKWAARRLGAWQLRGVHDGKQFALGVLTPRLTANSLFNDELFSPPRESIPANLVRSVLLTRLAVNVLGLPAPSELSADPVAPPPPRAYLRSIVAKVGAKIPEASVESAAYFTQAYPSSAEAWVALEDWASSGYIVTVSPEAFARSFDAVRNSIRRSESPSREHVDTVLPLAWDSRGRVVRVTFVRQGTDR